mmetsp:Transcript_37623/g.88320  ORF Transcript_37623/g.88320 Transcript_37623/m.88320 type:complete len:186 (+) Transcript_37623:223-780(+)
MARVLRSAIALLSLHAACGWSAAPPLRAVRSPAGRRGRPSPAMRLPKEVLPPLLLGDVACIIAVTVAGAALDSSSAPDFPGWLAPATSVDTELSSASCMAFCWLIGAMPRDIWSRDALALSTSGAVVRVTRAWLGAANARVAIALVQAAIFGRSAVDGCEVASSLAWTLLALGIFRVSLAAALRR